MKRALAILMAVVLLFSLSSCSQNELNLYNMMKGMASLDTFTFEGKTTININKLDVVQTDVPDETKEQIQQLKDTFNGKDIVYSGAIDSTNNTLKFQITMPSADGKTTEFDLQAKGQYLYLLKDPLAQQTDVSQMPVETMDGKEYVVIDLKTIVEELFANVERSIRNVTVAPNIPSGKPMYYSQGYIDGFFAAREDIINASSELKQAYNIFGEYDTLSDSDAQNYRDGFDSGYADCFERSKDERAQDENEIAELQKYKTTMMDKASATYLIKLFKGIALKSGDSVVYDLLDNFNTGLVQKVNDNKYSLHLGNDDIESLMTSLTNYMNNNQEKLAKMVSDILKSLSDEELIMLGVNPAQRNKLISEIEPGGPTVAATNVTSTTDNDVTETPVTIETGDETEKVLSDLDLSYDMTVEKTGSVSYNTNESFSIKTKPDAAQELGLDMDISATNSLSVNKNSNENIQIQPEVVGNPTDTASVKLNVSDTSVTEAGILYSTSANFCGNQKIAGTKQSDGTYSVSLTNLEKGTTYYFQAYAVDANGNTIYSGEVQNFKTLSINDTNTTSTTTNTTNTATTATTSSTKVPDTTITTATDTTAVSTTATSTTSGTSPNTGDTNASSSIWCILALCGLAGCLSVTGMKSRSKNKA